MCVWGGGNFNTQYSIMRPLTQPNNPFYPNNTIQLLSKANILHLGGEGGGVLQYSILNNATFNPTQQPFDPNNTIELLSKVYILHWGGGLIQYSILNNATFDPYPINL